MIVLSVGDRRPSSYFAAAARMGRCLATPCHNNQTLSAKIATGIAALLCAANNDADEHWQTATFIPG
jgi:hypothetical protein